MKTYEAVDTYLSNHDGKVDQPKICKASSPGGSSSVGEAQIRAVQVTADAMNLQQMKGVSDKNNDIIIKDVDVDIDHEVDDQRGNDSICINICGVEAEKLLQC